MFLEVYRYKADMKLDLPNNPTKGVTTRCRVFKMESILQLAPRLMVRLKNVNKFNRLNGVSATTLPDHTVGISATSFVIRR